MNPIVVDGADYQYALLGCGLPGQARLLCSPVMTMTRPEIAAELRALADWVEFGVAR